MRIKSTKKHALISFVLIVVLLIATAMPASASVDKTKIVTASLNQWFNANNYDYFYDEKNGEAIYTYYVYKVTVPSDGYLELSIKGWSLRLYKKLSDAVEHEYSREICEIHGNDTVKVAVDKGTYYVRAYGQVRCSFKAVKATGNYCMAKASRLAAKKTVTACMSNKHYYSRWYKITLKRRKQITFWSNQGDQVYVYDAKGRELDTEHAGTQSTRYFTKKQKKGTYYLRITPWGNDVITLKWK